MIQMETTLDIADNTGAKKAKMIRVLGKSNSRYARLGDIVVAHIRQAAPGADVKKGDVVKGVIVRQKKKHRRPDGSWIRFDRNAMVILQDLESKNTQLVFAARHLARRGVPDRAEIGAPAVFG